MGTLRNKMIDAMNLRRFSLRTHESYLGAVSGLAKYYNLPPDKIDAHQIRDYVLHLTVERGLSWSTCNVAVSAFRFFYVEVLGWERANLPIPPRKKPTKLPEVLSRQELERLFACARSARNRTLLMTTYAAGLRVSEVTSLKVSDVDSKRMMIGVTGRGKLLAATESTRCVTLRKQRFSSTGFIHNAPQRSSQLVLKGALWIKPCTLPGITPKLVKHPNKPFR